MATNTSGDGTGSLGLQRLALPVRPVATPDRRPFPQVAQLSLRLRTFRHLLARVLPPPEGRRLLDLGCGPGHFARLAARHGYRVTALDARPLWAVTGTGRSSPAAPAPASARYDFIQSDLRDFEGYAAFDVILCIGLFYHLPLVEQQLLLARCLGRPLLIDTELFDPVAMPAQEVGRFTPIVSPEGYEGALCAETGDVWSSHRNATSFWPTDVSILRLFADTGWRQVTIFDPAYCSPFGPRRWFLLHPPVPAAA